ncbi:hypothetical protein J7L27_02660 [Candidatus Bathyarchaeota archaeon]|nr:hypothetical protein [Candidatus Bathyarchaeota archaeon]
MAKFLAVHTLPTPLTPQEAAAFGKKTRENVTVDAYWIKSWAQLNDEGKIVRIFCEWNGTTMEDVHKVLCKSQLPLDGLYPMLVVDSEDFR